ncbi:MAG: hypothetical protein FXF54_00760 [Kosmotoga sp.]|nr:MAG: hypothetical protein FXF54_00760 [Kosmotoga sp.]
MNFKFKQKKIVGIALMIFFCLVVTGAGSFDIILFPDLSLNNYPTRESDYSPTLFDLIRFYKVPALASFGFSFDSDNFKAIMLAEVRQDLSAFLRGYDWSNLPICVDPSLPFPDGNYPIIGFIEYYPGNFHISIGRRKLKLGPGTYDLALSSVSPYYDHFWFEYNDNWLTNGNMQYNFFTISADEKVYDDNPKTLIGHKILLKSDHFSIGLGELNLIYGRIPDLQDLGPLIIYHHSYQDSSNVIAIVDFTLQFDKIKTYGEFIMDDFNLSSESVDSNPTALGFFAGAKYKIFDGEPFHTSGMLYEDHILRDRQVERGGLSIRYEYYRTSTYLYNRQVDIGKFTYPILLNVMALDSWPVINYPFGFPYGANSILHMIKTEYENKNLKVGLTFEYLSKGNYGIHDNYDKPFDLDWYEMTEPISNYFVISGDVQLGVFDGDTIMGNMGINVSEGTTNYFLNIGYGKQFSF